MSAAITTAQLLPPKSAARSKPTQPAPRPVARIEASPRQQLIQQCASSRAEVATERRSLILGGLLASIGFAAPQAEAGFGWDGVSAAQGSCPLGVEGEACRASTLKLDSSQMSSYSDRVNSASKQQVATGVPVASMSSDEYIEATLRVMEDIEQYSRLDVYDPDRVKLVKTIKQQGPAWASKYARGGSARKLSARKCYIVVDAIQAHFTSNGLAPLPRNKLKQLLANVEETKQLLADGR